MKLSDLLMRGGVMMVLFFAIHLPLFAQCPTGNVTGNLTITSNCTIAAGTNITVTGNVTLNANLTLEAGATLTITGTLSSNYVGSRTTYTITGGTVNVSTVSFGQNGILKLSGVTMNVTNNFSLGYYGGLELSGSTVTIGGNYSDATQTGTVLIQNSTLDVAGSITTSQSTSYTITNSVVKAGTTFTYGGKSSATTGLVVTASTITVGTNFTISETSKATFQSGTTVTVGGFFLNDNQAVTIFDASTLTLTNASSYLLNDFQASLTFQNASTVNIAGELRTEDQSTLTLDGAGTVVKVAGDMNNDYHANLNVLNDAKLIISGDFNNGVNYDGNVTTSGSVNIDGGYVSIGGDFNNEYGSDVSIEDDGALIVEEDVHIGQAASITVDGGTFVYHGTLTQDWGSGGVTSSSGDVLCTDHCCGVSCATLPVSLLSFELIADGGHITLNWVTVSEKSNAYFTVSRSYDGVSFEELCEVEGAGTSQAVNSYSYEDPSYQSKQVYYQLKQTDYDGTEEILGVKVVYPVSFNERASLKIAPNPVTRGGTISMIDVDLSGASYQLISIDGKLVRYGTVQSNEIPVSGIRTGVYVLRLNHYGTAFHTTVLVE